MSIAGGYFLAVEAAKRVGCDCVQLFTKNNNQWRAKPISDDEARQFQDSLRQLEIQSPLSHSSYLINLASPNPDLWQQSMEAMAIELQRAAQLHIPYVVMHPGSFTTDNERDGLRRVARGLDEAFARVESQTVACLLENTAGQGSNLGWRFEHLAEIIDLSQVPQRLGVCIDTCHTFAAGYPLSEPDDYAQTMSQLEQIVGLQRVKAVHLNDSKTPLGSRKDRHEHIGRGEMGLRPFWHFLNDPRIASVPMYLETEKGTERGEDLDAINLRTLRELIGAPMPAPSRVREDSPATPRKSKQKTRAPATGRRPPSKRSSKAVRGARPVRPRSKSARRRR
jgi:deoxyribonuclease-4